MQVDNLTLHELELAVKLASIDLIEFTARPGFLLEMPAGEDQPPHYVVVGTAEDIGWLLDAHAAKQAPVEPAIQAVGAERRH
ncbi:MAG TPA: hypothetical protein VFY73_15515 [Ideonella sp.]|uniref:hypothetical protein n=1 Tax=Ideonella sp. TaxID=1929293 RepID=UPI002E33E4CB|nr:hypothetical protein [Ideonella sp.]HEX5685428.1 hypothetical protein [Ideonella sp.]